MARCWSCGVDIGGGLFKKYNEGVIKGKYLPLMPYRVCSEECKEAFLAKMVPQMSDRDRRREERQKERERLRKEGKL